MIVLAEVSLTQIGYKIQTTIEFVCLQWYSVVLKATFFYFPVLKWLPYCKLFEPIFVMPYWTCHVCVPWVNLDPHLLSLPLPVRLTSSAPRTTSLCCWSPSPMSLWHKLSPIKTFLLMPCLWSPWCLVVGLLHCDQQPSLWGSFCMDQPLMWNTTSPTNWVVMDVKQA